MEDLQTELFFCSEVFSNQPNEENGKNNFAFRVCFQVIFDHRFSVYKCF